MPRQAKGTIRYVEPSTTKNGNGRGWNVYLRRDGQFVVQYREARGVWPEHRIPREHRTRHQAERYAAAYVPARLAQLAGAPEAMPQLVHVGRRGEVAIIVFDPSKTEHVTVSVRGGMMTLECGKGRADV